MYEQETFVNTVRIPYQAKMVQMHSQKLCKKSAHLSTFLFELGSWLHTQSFLVRFIVVSTTRKPWKGDFALVIPKDKRKYVCPKCGKQTPIEASSVEFAEKLCNNHSYGVFCVRMRTASDHTCPSHRHSFGPLCAHQLEKELNHKRY